MCRRAEAAKKQEESSLRLAYFVGHRCGGHLVSSHGAGLSGCAMGRGGAVCGGLQAPLCWTLPPPHRSAGLGMYLHGEEYSED